MIVHRWKYQQDVDFIEMKFQAMIRSEKTKIWTGNGWGEIQKKNTDEIISWFDGWYLE